MLAAVLPGKGGITGPGGTWPDAPTQWCTWGKTMAMSEEIRDLMQSSSPHPMHRHTHFFCDDQAQFAGCKIQGISYGVAIK